MDRPETTVCRLRKLNRDVPLLVCANHTGSNLAAVSICQYNRLTNGNVS
jgi:hypothetical protein